MKAAWEGRLIFGAAELFAPCSLTLHSIRYVKFCAIAATLAVSGAGDRAMVWKATLCLARNCVRASNEIAKFTFCGISPNSLAALRDSLL